jgi:hypothetical protein
MSKTRLTMDRIVTECTIFEIKRQDIVCAEVHFNMCKEITVNLDNELWYDHVPK